MSSKMLAALAALVLALQAVAAQPDPFVMFENKDLNGGFDLRNPGDGNAWWKICGGRQAVQNVCMQQGACDAYTFGGENDCGYLKSTGGNFDRFNGALSPNNKKWSTYIKYNSLPKSMGGGAQTGGNNNGGQQQHHNRPGACKTKWGPICCYKWDMKYNTCFPKMVWAPKDYNPANWGGVSYEQNRDNACKGDQPWDKAFASKVECCQTMNGDIGCGMGPGVQRCWVPIGNGQKACRETRDLGECNLKGIMGYYTKEECENMA